MARAWEGLPQQQQQQQQQGLSIVTSPADGGPSAQQNQAAAAAGGAGGGGKQWTPALIKSAGLGYEEGSRIYSDEEVQAVAAALPAPLTLQQQRLLADLLRLKRVRATAELGSNTRILGYSRAQNRASVSDPHMLVVWHMCSLREHGSFCVEVCQSCLVA
jgi:hypothetical protein